MVLTSEWLNAPEGVTSLQKRSIEERYAMWIALCADGDLRFLKGAFNENSRNHNEYRLLDVKAKLGTAPYFPDIKLMGAKFGLHFAEV